MSCLSSSGSEEEEEEIDSYRKGGYHAVRIGDSFNAGRYIAQRKLGWGEFSTVWLAYDTKTSEFVALKIQKSAPQFAQAALHEIEILTTIAKGDSMHSKCIVGLIDHFKHTGPNGQHLCIVLEFLGDSLLRLIRYNHHNGLDLNRVREICKCVLIGLDYLHQELKIIHTDLKLENILLVSPIDPSKDPVKSDFTPILDKVQGGNANCSTTMNINERKLKKKAKGAVALISGKSVGQKAKPQRCLDGIDMKCKVVDFGNACWVDKQFAEEIQTRQYRAPEVIIQSGYSTSADMWSFACIVFELATGEMLFTPTLTGSISEDEDHLALMMELLGRMPKKIANGGALSKDFFDRYGDLKRIKRLKFLTLNRLLIDKYKLSETDAREFAEFLKPMLDFAPQNRPTAQQCLNHSWLNPNLSNSNNTDTNVQKLEVGIKKLQMNNSKK